MATDPSSSRLGRGLGSMVNEVSGIKAGSRPNNSGFTRIPVGLIDGSIYMREPDESLVASIRRVGMLQPILVSAEGGRYKLLAGSRRLAAARQAGLADVPALVIPPDRAGALDVFLEENLTRAELSASQRAALRSQWMREFGRDEEQAGLRIPDPPAAGEAPYRDRNRLWRWAAAAATLLSIVLLLVVFKPDSVDETNQMDLAVEEILSGDIIDTSWMDRFAFRGSERSASGETLIVSHGRRAFSGTELTPSARVFLYQLAALLVASEKTLSVEIGAWDTNYATAAARCAEIAVLLHSEGVPEHVLTFRPHAAETAGNELELRLEPL